MQPVLNVEDVRRVELALKHAGVSMSELMHRAGAAAAQEVLSLPDVRTCVVLVGFGNNGGDGWVAAERLREAGVEVRIVSPVQPSQIKSDLALMAAKTAADHGIQIHVAPPRAQLENLFARADVVLDSMLGTGFHGEPATPFDIWIDALNASGARVVSVDVPSGLSAQTGHAPGGSVIADVTVTMIALKPGLLADDGRDACGTIVVAPLAEQTERLVLEADPVAWRMELKDYLEVMQPPSSAVDKYTRGSVLVVGGSSRFPGAPVLAAKAAARAGAGYVTLAVPSKAARVAQVHSLEIPVVSLPSEDGGTFAPEAKAAIAKLAQRSSAVLVGPGMRVTSATMGVVSTLLACDVPLILDADALNCLAQLTSNRLDSYPELLRRTAPVILTPHHRELGRLMGLPDTPPDSLTSALEAARRIVWAEGGSEIAVVAKGTATACIGVDTALIPRPGPAALATAGSGDVLGGIIAGLMARTTQLDNSQLPLICALGCEIHALAGALAAERFGSRGVMAGDVIDQVGLASDAVEDHATMPDEMPPAPPAPAPAAAAAPVQAMVATVDPTAELELD